MENRLKRLDALEANLIGLEQVTNAMARRAEREYLEHRKQLAVRKAKREVFAALIAAATEFDVTINGCVETSLAKWLEVQQKAMADASETD